MKRSSAVSLADHVSEQLRGLCGAIGLEASAASQVQLFRDLLGPTGAHSLAHPPWPSDVVDDHTPVEFSIAFEGDGGLGPRAGDGLGPRRADCALRVLFEPQGDPPSTRSHRVEARRTLERAARRLELSLDRFHAIEDLFLPDEPAGAFALWLALVLRAHGPPELKLYLDPAARGAARAPALVEEALARLGFEHAFAAVIGYGARRSPDRDRVSFFSLDLTRHPQARVKVYVSHHQVTADELEHAASAARHYLPGRVRDFCRTIGGHDGVFAARPPVSCFSFVAGDGERPSGYTLHLPIRDYVAHDGEARARLLAFAAEQMADARLPAIPAIIDRALAAAVHRPLEEGAGALSYVSLTQASGRPRLTMYLAPEAYRVAPPRTTPLVAPAPAPPPSPEALAARFTHEPITDHPFFRRLRREPVSLERLWVLFNAFRTGLSRHFPRRLALVIARVDDDRVRAILAKQLHEELGEGDYARAHLHLMDRLLAALATHRPLPTLPRHLAPGLLLEERLETPYQALDPWEGVGAAMVVEIYGQQVDAFAGDEFRRQRVIAGDALAWLSLHETLEVAHADESLALARLVPATPRAHGAVARGAQSIADTSWAFFDAMYGACFT